MELCHFIWCGFGPLMFDGECCMWCTLVVGEGHALELMETSLTRIMTAGQIITLMSMIDEKNHQYLAHA